MNTPFSLGGEQRTVSILANYLAKNHYKVYFLLTTSDKRTDYEFYSLDKSINVIFLHKQNSIYNRFKRKCIEFLKKQIYNDRIGKNNLKLQRWEYSINNKEIINVINRNEFDYVIGVASEYYSILANISRKLYRTKVIAWQHSTYEAYFETKNRRLYNHNSFSNLLFKNVDYYICQTEDDKDKIIKKFNYESIVINNPNTFSNCLKSKLDNYNFLALGRFTTVKGFEKLIDAFSIFSQKNDKWNLYIVGDGPDREKYIEKIKDYKLENRVILPGKTSDVEKYYLNSSIYLMSSLWEGWGMVVTEAMQYGLPVISFKLPSVEEIFGNEKCGILVDKYDVEQFADAMDKLTSDDKLLRKFSDMAQIQVKRFDIEIIGEKWKEILK